MALPLAGAPILASDLSSIFATGIGAWTPYTPTFTQSATITKTVVRGAYMKIGRLVVVNYRLSATSAGTASQSVRVGLPVQPVADFQAGTAMFVDASTSTVYLLGSICFASTSDMVFVSDGSGANLFGQTPAVTVASGDLIQGTFFYESAS